MAQTVRSGSEQPVGTPRGPVPAGQTYDDVYNPDGSPKNRGEATPAGVPPAPAGKTYDDVYNPDGTYKTTDGRVVTPDEGDRKSPSDFQSAPRTPAQQPQSHGTGRRQGGRPGQ